MPDELARILPGSAFGPEEFLRYLGKGDKETEGLAARLLSGESNLNLSLLQETGFSLNVFHGSVNEQALSISCLAKEGFDDPEVRVEYQGSVAEIVKPIFAKESKYDLRIVEDCLASGETVAGVLAALGEKSEISIRGKIRVDVAVATTQGILILREFAKQNNLDLEINVGYLACGLSKGSEVEGTPARSHANYITYPPEILERLPKETRQLLESLKIGEDVFVVGDMGDAGKSLPKEYDKRCSWNRQRKDSHGDRGVTEETLLQSYSKDRPTIVYLANGGYLMRALLKDQKPDLDVNEIVFDAKRVWAEEPEYGYGVLIYKFPKGLLLVG